MPGEPETAGPPASPAFADRLRRRLETAGVWTAPILHERTVGSTNAVLKDLAREGAPEWTVVVADRQTAGRGRGQHAWVSPAGNLYLSVLLRPTFGRVTLLPLLAGLAVADAVQEQAVDARLKWPNDVLANGKKLAGILTESASSATGIDWVVIGIGVNLDPAAPLPETATSVRAMARGQEVAPSLREAVAAAVLGRLAVWYDALRQDGGRTLVTAWTARALPWWGRTIQATSGGEILRGVARAVDDDGALVLELPGGERRAVLSGEVREVRLTSHPAEP
jgi:BirA family transcriptional regulator, biotin operon repressor / biotin---[acetyl-CoA-carboxylase] ligase